MESSIFESPIPLYIAKTVVIVSTLYVASLLAMVHAVYEDEGYRKSVLVLAKVLFLASAAFFSEQFQRPVPQVVQMLAALVCFHQARAAYKKYVSGTKYKEVDLTDKVYIVTGSNQGIGFETAKALVKMNATVVLACRSLDKANEARQAIIDFTKCAPSKVVVSKLDLCGFDSVKKFVKEFRSMNLPLHGLINNAGVMNENRSLTQDGFEIVFTGNHLSHFLLTNLLLPDLEKTGGRVVVLSSSLHKAVPRFNFDDVMSENTYSLFGTYARSKLANVLFAFELQRRLAAKASKVTCNAVHPGIVQTDFARNMNSMVVFLYGLAAPFCLLYQKTGEEGCYCSVYAACGPELEGKGGLYLANSRPFPASPGACNGEDAMKLWALSERLTGLVQPSG